MNTDEGLRDRDESAPTEPGDADAETGTDRGHGDVQRGDRAAVGSGGRALASDRLPDEGVGSGEPTRVAQRRVVVPDQCVVVAWEAVVDCRADQRGVVGVGVPGLRYLPAVAGGEEVVGTTLRHVEAERAAVLTAVDRVTRCEQWPEDATRAVDLNGIVFQRSDVRCGDGSVRGDHDFAGRRVGVPGNAFDG